MNLQASLELKESREKGVFVNGLSSTPCVSVQEISRKLQVCTGACVLLAAPWGRK